MKNFLSRRVTVPNLVVAQRVIDKMVAAASRFIEDETGEAMVGLVVPGAQVGGVPTVYVLETISPDETAVRQMHTFQQGDPWQDEVIWWYQENWHKQRQKHQRGLFKPRAEWDVPLRYLGDWHKQPGYMIAPSGGDLHTALNWLDDPENDTDWLLVPIVTLDHPATIDTDPATVNYTVVPTGEGTAMRVDWWFVHVDGRMFQPMNPAIYPDDKLPDLAPLPWHLKDEERAEDELARLDDAGIAVTMVLSDNDDKLPLKISFSAARMKGGTKIYLIVTQADYPQSPPVMRLMPFVSMQRGENVADLFKTWWRDAAPVNAPPNFTWTADHRLIDYIEAVEQHMGLYTPPQPVTDNPPEENDA